MREGIILFEFKYKMGKTKHKMFQTVIFGFCLFGCVVTLDMDTLHCNSNCKKTEVINGMKKKPGVCSGFKVHLFELCRKIFVLLAAGCKWLRILVVIREAAYVQHTTSFIHIKLSEYKL